MRTTLLLGLVLSVFGAGCYTGGLSDLQEARDPLVPCDGATTTWLRAVTPDPGSGIQGNSTEVLVLGGSDPLEASVAGDSRCYALGTLLSNSETTLLAGSYTMDTTGNGSFVYASKYYLPFQPSIGVLSRDGAKHFSVLPAESEAVTLAMQGSTLVVTSGNEVRRYTALPDVVETANANAGTQGGAEDIFRLYNLPLFTSQVRVPGFGNGGMTQYALPAPVPFNALIQETPDDPTMLSNFTVQVESALKPVTHIIYHQYEDLTDIRIDGEQITDVSLSAKGTMRGKLNFLMFGRTNPDIALISGNVDYANLLIKDGLAGGGSYVLTIAGQPTTYTIDFTIATQNDLTTHGLLTAQ